MNQITCIQKEQAFKGKGNDKKRDTSFNNTKLETPDPDRHKFGEVYLENEQQKMKLNLQIRFIK